MSETPNNVRMIEGAGGLAEDPKHFIDGLLRKLSFRSEVFFTGQPCGAWALDTSGSGKVGFHLVGHGTCWLHVPYLDRPVRLDGGDILVFPHDTPHSVSSTPEGPAQYGVRAMERQIPLDSAAEGTGLICGYLGLEDTARRLLFAGLPQHLLLRGDGLAPIGRLLSLLFAEAREDALGSAAVLDRLADALLLYVVRESVASRHRSAGLLGVLRDPQLWPAVDALCGEPGRPWTVDALAERVHLSRSAFADRFQVSAGLSPIELLTLWRMHLARGWLEDERLPIAEVAERSGYRSESAFGKAFKRVLGVSPGEFRRRSVDDG